MSLTGDNTDHAHKVTSIVPGLINVTNTFIGINNISLAHSK